MTCRDNCIHYNVCGYYAEFNDDADNCTQFKNEDNFVELKNMKWRPYYYRFKTGEKMQEGWCCSVCGKRSHSRKEVCDGCNTIMWKVEIQ